jgi:hypothetical protein
MKDNGIQLNLMNQNHLLMNALRDVLNGLYALRDHAQLEHGPEFGLVEQKLINLGIEALREVEKVTRL